MSFYLTIVIFFYIMSKIDAVGFTVTMIHDKPLFTTTTGFARIINSKSVSGELELTSTLLLFSLKTQTYCTALN